MLCLSACCEKPSSGFHTRTQLRQTGGSGTGYCSQSQLNCSLSRSMHGRSRPALPAAAAATAAATAPATAAINSGSGRDCLRPILLSEKRGLRCSIACDDPQLIACSRARRAGFARFLSLHAISGSIASGLLHGGLLRPSRLSTTTLNFAHGALRRPLHRPLGSHALCSLCAALRGPQDRSLPGWGHQL